MSRGDGNMPKISIITPIYCDISQKVDWLDELIISVQAQTEHDWELILIDDKSPLPFGEVQQKHDSDSRLRWFENAENSGPAKTRNTAVALASSECILPLDSDDLLASPDVLETMYNEWLLDKTKIIYGNLCQYLPVANTGKFQRGKIIELGSYTFELAMNLTGVMPVTSMHSKDCHLAAGGWKDDLREGLEDIEYLISAGERGFCGIKINHLTLVYRRQEKSRAYELKHGNRQFETMQQKIKTMHNQIYQGRFPEMACGCNENKAQSIDSAVMSMQGSSRNARIIELSGFEESSLEWVLYDGGRTGRFDIVARGAKNLPPSYTIYGKGQIFQIHKSHRNIFSDRQRSGFRMNQPDPRTVIKEEIRTPEAVEVVRLEPSQIPEMSTIVRMDSIAAKTIKADIQPMPDDFTEMNIKPLGKENIIYEKFSLNDLGLSISATNVLARDQVRLWTVEKLARTTPEVLVSYQGIGPTRAKAIISKAQSLINKD